jgi:hypothetical protein
MPADFVRPERTPGIAGIWKMVQEAPPGESQWTLTPRRDNQYDAVEEGLGNARGVAVLNGHEVRIDWAASNPGDLTTGRFVWQVNDDFTSASATVEFFTVHTDFGIINARFIRIS